MSRRKNRRNAAQPPVQAPSLPQPTEAPTEELRALRARLDRIEQDQSPRDAWALLADRHRIAHEREIAANTRTRPDSPCRACGDAQAVQRRLAHPEVLGSSGWLCDPCIQAVAPGWGTQSTRTMNRTQGLDRLACLAAGMDQPTKGFTVLASRYGLTFSLAQDSPGGDGTAWSHLNTAPWREVGAKAVQRAAAGFGVFPAADPRRLLAPPDVELAPAYNRVTGAIHPAITEKAPVLPTTEELTAQLRAEEAAITQALKTQARQEKEEAAQAEKERREREIRSLHRAHQARLQAEYRAQSRALRGDLTAALTEHAVRGL